MRTADSKILGLYVGGVTAIGLGLLVLLAWTGGFADLQVGSTELWLLGAFAVLGELLPIRISRGGEREEITTSMTFVFAILLTAGIVPAMVAQGVASLVGDLVGRKPLWKAGFNIAQTTVALAFAGEVLARLADLSYWEGAALLRPSDVPAVVVSAAVFFLLNNVLAGVALALAQRAPILGYLRGDLAFQALIAAILLSLSPAVVIVADFSLLLVPLLALPVVAVYRSANASLDNARLVVELERSLDRLKEEAARNEHQALYDALTDLPNRTLFHDRVERAIAIGRRRASAAAVMIMDLDHFKEVNDTLGHQNGDLLLQEIGNRLRGLLRQSDTIARLGGDEFGLLLADLPQAGGALRTAEKILEALRDPFLVEGLTLDVTGSIGIALFPEHGQDVDTLLQRADVAMYVAKAAHSGYELYKAHQDRYSPAQLALVSELRRAIEAGEMVVHYQPKAELRSGAIVGVEGLVRWRHPDRGLVSPTDFLPIAEHTGVIRPLTSAVLDIALQDCREWADAGLETPVAVNLSARNLNDLHLPEEVSRLLDKWDVPARLLELEITETSIMSDPNRAVEVLGRLRDLGVLLSIDDFGTGYSSLAFLKHLPIGEIKIDRSFVLHMLRNEDDAVIVRSTIDLGRNLGLRVVAEGVENSAIWEALAELGCDLAQGLFVGVPVPSAELLVRLAESGARSRERDLPSLETLRRRASRQPAFRPATG